jgi:hypothetical protein
MLFCIDDLIDELLCSCHGKIHHDTHRLTQFIQALLHHHYDVELHHEEADAIRVDECSAGFVKVTNSHGVQLFYCPDFQDDTNAPHYETFAIEMAKEVMHAVRSIGK